MARTRDPYDVERLAKARFKLEEGGPPEWKASREALYRFLAEPLKRRDRTGLSPFRVSAWRTLHRCFPPDPESRVEWMADFFTDLWTALEAERTDEASRANIGHSSKAMPRWERDRLKAKLRAEEKTIPPSEREQFYSRLVKTLEFDGERGAVQSDSERTPRLRRNVYVRDLLQPRRGSGRRSSFDSPLERIMWTLVGTYRLSPRTAGVVANDLLLWVRGYRCQSAAAVTKAWIRREHDPSTAPSQP